VGYTLHSSAQLHVNASTAHLAQDSSSYFYRERRNRKAVRKDWTDRERKLGDQQALGVTPTPAPKRKSTSSAGYKFKKSQTSTVTAVGSSDTT
jgi:hypothetical protein